MRRAVRKISLSDVCTDTVKLADFETEFGDNLASERGRLDIASGLDRELVL